jgi:hypothetical protein
VNDYQFFQLASGHQDKAQNRLSRSDYLPCGVGLKGRREMFTYSSLRVQ